ncbi:MAG: helix-turn-helix domain-containing protein [Myxococcaceae bacterium]|nr:helix-turn-helix domain-containing protein [Myxococcaceae bacterium]
MDGLDKRTLGRNIREARRQLGLTQEQMAERLEMSPEEYGRVERGNLAPRLERFLAICRILGETPERLMSARGAPAPEPRNPSQAPEERLRILRMTLAVNVREARQQLGLTQAEMAERINMPVATYGRMERGNLLPSLESFVAICRVLGDLAGTLLDPPRPRKRH